MPRAHHHQIGLIGNRGGKGTIGCIDHGSSEHFRWCTDTPRHIKSDRNKQSGCRIIRQHIGQSGGDICATNIWVKPGIRNEKVGDKLIMDIEPISQSRYEGKARDVRREMTYSMEVFVDGTKMRTRGCVLGKLICKSAHWTSVN